jgi:GNAT superfamily N-acetyltransferase
MPPIMPGRAAGLQHGPCHDGGVDIRRIADVEAIEAGAALFDSAPRPDAARRFVAEPGHHLLIAYVDGVPAGMVTGVEMTHPDKGTEMFLYELGVDEPYRGRGIGRALVSALADLARERGCYGMWVLTDDGNPAALRAYAAAGGEREPVAVMFSWTF